MAQSCLWFSASHSVSRADGACHAVREVCAEDQSAKPVNLNRKSCFVRKTLSGVASPPTPVNSWGNLMFLSAHRVLASLPFVFRAGESG